MPSDTPCLLDTNVVLRYFTRDDPEKADHARGLIERLKTVNETAITSHAVIFETAFTMQSYYRVAKADIRDSLSAILALRGLRIDERDLLIEALELFADRNVSLPDAYNAVFARSRGIPCVYSWDRDFDKFSWLARHEPST